MADTPTDWDARLAEALRPFCFRVDVPKAVAAVREVFAGPGPADYDKGYDAGFADGVADAQERADEQDHDGPR